MQPTGSTSHEGPRRGSTSLTAVADEQQALARTVAHSGRAARTIHGGYDDTFRQTVLALLAGYELAEPSGPGEATLQVLRGRVRLTTGGDSWDGAAGDHVNVPPECHALLALDDSVVLLTVVSPRRPWSWLLAEFPGPAGTRDTEGNCPGAGSGHHSRAPR